MKRASNIWLIVLLVSLSILTSCKEDIPVATKETSEISISITSPSINEMVSGPTEMHLDGIIDANALLGGWKSILIDSNSGEIIDEYEDYYSQTQYIVHHHWIINPNDTLNLEVIVQALSVEQEVLEEKSVNFIWTP